MIPSRGQSRRAFAEMLCGVEGLEHARFHSALTHPGAVIAAKY